MAKIKFFFFNLKNIALILTKWMEIKTVLQKIGNQNFISSFLNAYYTKISKIVETEFSTPSSRKIVHLNLKKLMLSKF